MHDSRPPATPLVALAHEVLNCDGPFDSLSDYAEAVKRQAARLHLDYDATRISEALLAVSRTRPLPMLAGLIETHVAIRIERTDDVQPLSREDAAAFLNHLRSRYPAKRHVA